MEVQITTLIFDIETNGLLPDMDTVHSLVIRDADDGTIHSCHHGGYKTIEDGLALLNKADVLVGHNIIQFDIPALQHVYPDFAPKAVLRDTLLLTRLLWPEIKGSDFKRFKTGKFPGNLIGSFGLEAWGYRMKNWKGDYSKDMKAKGLDPWAEWNQDMQDYCVQDVEVTDELWKRCLKQIADTGYAEAAIEMEHDFAYIMHLMEQRGFSFDKAEAVRLYAVLSKRREEITREMAEAFPDWWRSVGEMVPKRGNKTVGYVKDTPLTKVELTSFNPNSRDHIADRLKAKYGWEPQFFTPDGKAKLDEEVLNDLPFPEAKLLAEAFMVEKRIGQIAEGKQAWLKLERDGRLHGRILTAGAVTRRCTHSRPNMAQVPATGKPYGEECRRLFYAREGFSLVGWDASGLELRCLAHYMGRYDGGAYGKVLLEGDIHTANQLAAGLPTRPNAKTFIYAYLYGAGDEKIGSIVGGGAAVGKKLKREFLKKTPALKHVRDALNAAIKSRRQIKSIDGGTLTIRHRHAALNTLLQSAGAISVKLATVILYQDLSTRGWVWGEDYAFVGHIHDEVQAEVRKGKEDEYGELAVNAIRKAGEVLGFRCPLDGEYKVGETWADTH